jgi:hypothetical protein
MNFNVNILKEFNGIHNYFNCTGLNSNILYRRQKKYKNELLVSDIVDTNDNVILKSHTVDDVIISYEDPRFITDDIISVCVAYVDFADLENIKELQHNVYSSVNYKLYNLKTNQFKSFKTKKFKFEKHWQFYNDIIIYHIHPYTLLNSNEDEIYSNYFNFDGWILTYGNPCLSTNVFEIDNVKYLLFHSNINSNGGLKYFIGLLKLDSNLIPIGYYNIPFIESDFKYSPNHLISSMWRWRSTNAMDAIKYEVFFPLNVEVNNCIKIYGGMNECMSVVIDIDFSTFNTFISNDSFICF